MCLDSYVMFHCFQAQEAWWHWVKVHSLSKNSIKGLVICQFFVRSAVTFSNAHGSDVTFSCAFEKACPACEKDERWIDSTFDEGCRNRCYSKPTYQLSNESVSQMWHRRGGCGLLVTLSAPCSTVFVYLCVREKELSMFHTGSGQFFSENLYGNSLLFLQLPSCITG